MDELHVDLCDHRGRLLRLAAAVAVAAVVTAIVMRWIVAVSAAPNADPIGGSLVGLVAICIFVPLCVAASWAIAALARRRARK